MLRKRYAFVRVSSWLVCLCAFVVFASLASSAQSRPKAEERTVIFAVSVQYFPADSVTHKGIEPIVIIDGKSYVKPPSNDDELAKFGKSYYREGQIYRLFFGGAEAGAVSVKKWSDSDLHGCFYPGAEVEIKSPLELGGDSKALATNSTVSGRQKSSRRAPSSDEKAAILKLAQETYRQKGVPVTLLQSIKVVTLIATDLDGDGVAELIGNFKIGDSRDETPVHSLFLIAAKQSGAYQMELVWYHAGAETHYEARSFVDQLDLDGDGVDEIVTEGSYYESGDYQIYKKRKGQWLMVYKGGGGGC